MSIVMNPKSHCLSVPRWLCIIDLLTSVSFLRNVGLNTINVEWDVRVRNAREVCCSNGLNWSLIQQSFQKYEQCHLLKSSMTPLSYLIVGQGSFWLCIVFWWGFCNLLSCSRRASQRGFKSAATPTPFIPPPPAICCSSWAQTKAPPLWHTHSHKHTHTHTLSRLTYHHAGDGIGSARKPEQWGTFI